MVWDGGGGWGLACEEPSHEVAPSREHCTMVGVAMGSERIPECSPAALVGGFEKRW